MQRILTLGGFLLFASAMIAPTGCAQPQQPAMGGAKGPPEVYVSLPVVKEITDFEEFPGRLEADQSVQIRARVTGYLLRFNFKEGGMVKKGDILFEIDPQLYEADLAIAEGAVLEAEGQYDQAKADWQRAQKLRIPIEISQEDVNKFRGAYVVSEGKLKSARATLKKARINMAYTKVLAPMSGRVSRTAIDPGNLVRADDTLLTSLGASDPLKATFDLDERTLAQILRLIKQGSLNTERKDRTDFTGTPVQMWLADEDMDKDKPLTGAIDFTDNNVDPSTGTYRVRGAFANPDGLLVPGMFVRVRVPIGKPRQAILVEEKALITDQGQKYVYVLKNENSAQQEATVEYRRVVLGRLHEGLRVIKEQLAADEKIIVSGLQRVPPDVKDFKVKFKEQPAPAPAGNDLPDPTKAKPTSEPSAVSQTTNDKVPPAGTKPDNGAAKKRKGR